VPRHGTLKGGIGLETYYHAHRPTDAGEALLAPGDAGKSVLLRVVAATDPEKRMPPKGEALTAGEIDLLKRWIEAGAKWPDDGWRPPLHWAYVAPKRDHRRAKPARPDDRHPNEIDVFIAANSTNTASRSIPKPIPRISSAAPASTSPDCRPLPLRSTPFSPTRLLRHYSRLVDELLASPAYGEKWAVPWLDLARYADSEGYQRDAPRNMWPWRDWVITALNEDMPFDQFSIEQLAGDLLPDATESQKIATAFHRNAPLNLEAGTDPDEDHYKQIVDRVNTTGTIWLGSTVGCAQCHNHKYDPISAREYYELFAFFNNSPMESKQQGMEMGMSNMVHIGPCWR
jgi:hypothetical protein